MQLEFYFLELPILAKIIKSCTIPRTSLIFQSNPRHAMPCHDPCNTNAKARAGATIIKLPLINLPKRLCYRR